MLDYNKILDAGDYQNGVVNAVIEIPAGSNQKIEFNRDKGYLFLDRIDPAIFPKPTNYGFIPQTLDEDGDELDILMFTKQPLPTGLVVSGKVLGVMKFEDDGEVDDKIILVPADDRSTGNPYQTLEDLPKRYIEQLEHYFTHYKDLKKPGSTKVIGFFGEDEAKKVIKDSIDRWNNR